MPNEYKAIISLSYKNFLYTYNTVKNKDTGNMINNNNGIRHIVRLIKSNILAPWLNIISKYLIDWTIQAIPQTAKVINKNGKNKFLYIFFS